MSNAVSFDNVSYSGLTDDLSFKIKTGTCALIITAREEESSLLAELLTGMTQADSGSISISGHLLAETNQELLFQIRSKMGIIPVSGGLISNLKVWENIFLPYMYHVGKPTVSDEEIADNYLKEFNYTGSVMALPAHLTLYEKRAVAFIRAAVMNPNIMLYCNIFDKISQLHQTRLANVINGYSDESVARTSIFIDSSEHIPLNHVFDTVISIHKQ